MLCPNCDSVLNAIGCQSCGWKRGDPFPAHRMAIGTAHPLKPGIDTYPAHEGKPKAIPIVSVDPGVQPETVPSPLASGGLRVAPGFKAPASSKEPAPAAEVIAPNKPAEPEPPAIPDPANKTVQ